MTPNCNFGDALAYVKKGGNVTRPCWPAGNYVYLKTLIMNQYLYYQMTDSEYIYTAVCDDLLAEDWILL